MLDPPSPLQYQAFDVLAELEALENDYPTNGFDYLEAIKNILAKFKDAHTYFYPPCFKGFSFELPFLLTLETESSDGPEVVLHSLDESASAFDGFVVEAIALDNTTYPSNEKAWETLAAWAEDNVWSYRTPVAQLNAVASRAAFTSRPIASVPVPTVGAIRLNLTNTSSGDSVEQSFEWTAYVGVNVPDMKSLCPLSASWTSSGNMRNGRDRAADKVSPRDRLVSNRIMEAIRVSIEAEKNNRTNKGAEVKKAMQHELQSYVLEIIREGERRMDHRLREMTQSPFPETMLQKREKTFLTSRTNSDQTLQTLSAGDHLLTGLIEPDNIGYIQIDSFDIADSDAFARRVVEALSYFKAHEITKLAIDLVGNGGGLVRDSDTLYRMLFPDQFPVFARRRVVNSTLGLLLASHNLVEYYDPSQPLSDLSDTEAISHTGLGVTRTRNWTQSFAWNFDSEDHYDHYTEKTDYFHKRWYDPDNILILTDGRCGSACSQFIKHVSETHTAKVLGYGSHWLRNATVDYDIGSFAGGNVIDSDTVNNLRNRLGTVVQLLIEEGGTATSEGAEFVAEVLEMLADLPEEFPRPSSIMRIDLTTAFSFDPTTPDAQPEFKILPPDEITDSYPTYGNPLSERLQVISNHSGMYDTCYGWSVHATDACLAAAEAAATDAGETLPEHMTYGQPCNNETGGYETDSCVEAGCEVGYYMATNGSCVQSKYTWSTYVATPCDFGSRTVVTAEEAIACMRTLPLDKEGENNRTVSLLLEWLESYASTDVMLNPPAPLTGAVDILEVLDNIDADTTYTNGYDFHRDIAHAINKMQDAHTIYQMPCGSAFRVALPIIFWINPTATGFAVTVHPNPLSNNALYLAWTDSSKYNISDLTVRTITIPGLGAIEDERPEMTLARFADSLSLFYRTPGSRLSSFLKEIQYGVTLNLYEPKGNVVVTAETSGGENVTLSLPWLAVKSSEFAGRDLEALCPLANDTAIDRSTKRNSQRTPNRRKSSDELREIVEQTKKASTEDEYLQAVCKVFLDKPEYLELLNSASTRVTHLEHSEEPKPKITAPRYIQRAIHDTIEIQTSSKRNTEGIVLPSSSGYLYAVAFETNSTVYLRVPTFHITEVDAMLAWIADILSYTKVLLSMDDGYLIIDLSGNGGGLLVLGDLLSSVLFPESFPLFRGDYTPNSAVNREEIVSDIEAGVIMQFISGESVTSIDQLQSSNITVSSAGRNRTREWLGPFSRSPGPLADIVSLLRLTSEFPNEYYISPQHTLIITDGTCASTCCLFVKRSQELHLAKVAGFGINLIDETGFDSGGTCSVPVYDTMDLVETLSSAPGTFAREGTTFSYSAGNSLSFDVDTPDTWIEYKIVPTDTVYPLFLQPEGLTPDLSQITQVVSLISGDWDQCAAWEVQEDTCTPSKSLAHARYGHPCNVSSHRFDTSTCVFARCDNGYYLSSDHSCIATPSSGSSYFSAGSSGDDDLETWAIVVIVVLAVLALIGIVGWIMTILLCWKKSGRGGWTAEMQSSVSRA